MGRERGRPADVFLNIPYDQKSERLYLAYIAGLCAFGLVPRAALEIPRHTGRLSHILALLGACPFALHDLSRVELDRRPPCTPRFNMPFELGLSVALRSLGPRKHVWFVLEAKDHRLAKSLSDLNGIHPHIHHGKAAGIFRVLANIFVRRDRRPTVQQMNRVYRDLTGNLSEILRSSGAQSSFGPRVFRDLCVVASESADRNVR
jgi:hypothetical protein